MKNKLFLISCLATTIFVNSIASDTTAGGAALAASSSLVVNKKVKSFEVIAEEAKKREVVDCRLLKTIFGSVEEEEFKFFKTTNHSGTHNVLLTAFYLSTRLGSEAFEETTRQDIGKVRLACFKNPYTRRIIAESYREPASYGSQGTQFCLLPANLSHLIKEGELHSSCVKSSTQVLYDTDKNFKQKVDEMNESIKKGIMKIDTLREFTPGMCAQLHETLPKQFPLLRVQDMPRKGFGVVAAEDIEPHTFVAAWQGDIVLASVDYLKNIDNSDGLLIEGSENMQMALNIVEMLSNYQKSLLIEPRNISIFINHSNNPNLKLVYKNDENRFLILMQTTERVVKGKELTWHYGDDYWEARGITPQP